ncbi:MAG: DNA polymerase I [Flavobacteriales bacterium]
MDNQTMEEKKIFLLDAYALIFRAYYAFIKNPRINSKGFNTSAVLGFTNSLLDIINNQKPTHLAVVFDYPAQTFRSKEYAAYKANRQETPEDIKLSVPVIMDVVKAFNIPILMKEGFEADDVIGTLSVMAEKAGFTTYMMTPDKDFAQLVNEKTFMYKPARGGKQAEVWGVDEVKAAFEVEDPKQVIDILGLWGDAADNIPGIPGIGEKTSKKLIAKYGSMENLIANADADLKGKQRENVMNFAEQGLLSKMLATIILDVPVEFNEEDLKMCDPDKDKVIELFSELEFRTLTKRVFGVEIQQTDSGDQLDMFSVNVPKTEAEQIPVAPAEFKTLENSETNYSLVDTKEKREELIAKLMNEKSVCFDTETTSLDSLNAKLVGIAFSYKKGEAFYVSIPQEQKEAQEIVNEFKAFFENENIEKIAHNLKYDLAVMKNYGIEFRGKLFDTMIAHYLIQPDMRHNMDLLAETYLGYKPVSIESLIGKKGKNQKNMADLEPSEVSDYACEDADITFQLKELFAPKLTDTDTEKLYKEIEAPLIPVLEKMEREGINLDVPALAEFSQELEKDLVKFEADIKEMAGFDDFNLDSPKQLGEVLFEKMDIDVKAKKTKTGQYSTSEDTLSKMVGKHEIFELILEYRSLKKLKSTYVDALPLLVDEKTHRIHTSYMQTVAATGRLSSVNPNLQNIPIRTEKGRLIRKAFIPRDENHTLLAADYSQIELRIIAALSEDEGMIEAFNSGHDIHTATAAKVFDVTMEEVDREMRSKAKMVNFGIIYGISAFGLGQRLSIPRKEAKEIIESYFAKYPKIKSYMDEVVVIAKEKGYVETLLGRRRNLKDINSANAIVRSHAERNAINAPIQGTAADIIKIAMINVQAEMEAKNLKSRMLLQVHDELVFDVEKSEVEVMKQLVKENMEGAVKIAVPLDVEMNTGDNWLQAH